MSTSTDTTAPQTRAAAARHGLTFGGVLRSEWIKLWTLMSTRILLLLTLLATVGVGTLTILVRFSILDQMAKSAREQGLEPSSGMLTESMPAGSGLDLYNLPNAGLQIGILIIGALAVLFMSSEYATGMIRSTMSAVPRRTPAFLAKAIILAVISYVITTVAGVATFFIAQPVFRGLGIDLDWSTEGVLYSVFTGGLYVAGVALIGLSLGTLLRNSAGAITVLVGIFFVLPIASSAATLIPGDFWKYVPQYIPSEAGGRFLSIGHIDAFIDPWQGGLIFLGYVLLFFIPALLVLKKRDV
ncbi:ABC-2 family transporter protein [Arthrobacter ulcerisalmonis]|uniref:ABC-2 family transporter protein n=2 Tax=Arthrobacter ulcerisalmonis TaxID=2483813 RepID=A0A3P5W9W7_9MICC|nr:ABC transporter permease subunit [Arthrobacter ulcerisalmonis]VDC17908.1 ABC-2 family transporter protein [Arthrobacter ulcerisalmonis]